MMLHDSRGRPLRDLRISVTDRCNFRCSYCMPKDAFGPTHQFLARRELLTYEEIQQVATVFIDLGIKKIRLTGGEPLLRRDLPQLIGMLSSLPGLDDLSLTTNGFLLGNQARALRDAGLGRLTVSLDSLDDAVFRRMNDVDISVDAVLSGIHAAERAGFTTIKINAVVRRGINDHDLVDLARHFQGRGHILRFIEFMDVGSTNGWRLDQVMSGQEILQALADSLPLIPLEPAYQGEVARRYRYAEGGGEIGIITAVSRPFCSDCTRARLSPEGKLFTCLFATSGTDLRAPLRDSTSSDDLRETIVSTWQRRDDRYSEDRARSTPALPRIEMSYIGG